MRWAPSQSVQSQYIKFFQYCPLIHFTSSRLGKSVYAWKLLTVCRDNIVARQSMQADTRLSFARRVQMTISLIGLALVLSKHMLPWNGVIELQLDADNDQALE